METKIELFRVNLDSNQVNSNSEVLSKQAFNQLFNHPSFDGKTVVVNIKCSLPKKGMLFLVSGDTQPVPSNNGKPIDLLSFRKIIGFPMVFGEEYSDFEKSSSANKSDQSTSENNSKNGNDKMTEPQTRYLFRLLAEHKNLKGKKAEEYLKKAFAVSDIGDIRKKNASELIDQFVNGGKSND